MFDHIPTAWKGHGAFADWLVKKIRPQVTVDLGVDHGFSTFCFGAPKIGHVYGVDSFEGDPCAGERDVMTTYWTVLNLQEQLGLNSNITFIRSYFDDLAKIWNKPINILHIDGDHSYEAVKNDFLTWSRFMKDDGVILMHDTCVQDPRFGVNKFFEEIPYPKLTFTHTHGLGVVTHNTELLQEIQQTFDLNNP